MTMAQYFSDNIPQFKFLKKIGEGGYGSVYSVVHPKWGEVVLKKLRDSNDIGEKDLDYLRHEADILKSLNHPNVVKFHEGRFDSELCGFFLEYMEYGSVDCFQDKFSVD